MRNNETNSAPAPDDIETKQDIFVDNRRIIAEAEAKMSDPGLSREEREALVNTRLHKSLANIAAAQLDPRVVDKAIGLNQR